MVSLGRFQLTLQQFGRFQLALQRFRWARVDQTTSGSFEGASKTPLQLPGYYRLTKRYKKVHLKHTVSIINCIIFYILFNRLLLKAD